MPGGWRGGRAYTEYRLLHHRPSWSREHQARYYLEARDAFSGVLLWNRQTHFHGFSKGKLALASGEGYFAHIAPM